MPSMPSYMHLHRSQDGRVTEALTNVFDAEGLSLGMFDSKTRAFLAAISKVDSDNYPETLGRLLIINAPFFFHTIWTVVSTFLDERTLTKIKVVGADYQKDLFEVLGGAENVPTEYGGKLEVPGGLYAGGTPDTTIHAGKVREMHRRVPKGYKFRIRWLSRPADIEFSVHFAKGPGAAALLKTDQDHGEKDEGSNKASMQELYGLKAHPGSDARMVEVSGTADEDGVLVVTWDNSKGWHQRMVIYTLTVTAPGSIEKGTTNDIVRCGHLAGPKSKAVAALLAEKEKEKAGAGAGSGAGVPGFGDDGTAAGGGGGD